MRFILLVAFGSTYLLNAQNKNSVNPEVEIVSRLSKDSLIDYATKLIDNLTFNPNNFDSIEGWSSQDGVFIKFLRYVQVMPKTGRLCFSVTVDLINKSIGYSELGGRNANDEIIFYTPNANDKKIIEWVTKVITDNGSNELPNATITIDEQDQYFNVSVDTESAFGRFKIDKPSSKKFDESHKHKVPSVDSTYRKLF